MIADERGILSVVEAKNTVPFKIRRVFWITKVPQGEVRGGHAHLECRQAIFALSGSFWIRITKVQSEAEIFASQIALGTGVLVEPGEVVSLYSFSSDAICLVLCSEHYDKDDYYELSSQEERRSVYTFYATDTSEAATQTAGRGISESNVFGKIYTSE